MAKSNQPSGRRYPVILETYTAFAGMREYKEDTHFVFNDLHYDTIVENAKRSGMGVRELQTNMVAEEIIKEEQAAQEIAALNKRKLILDVKTGERIYKTYFWTQGVAWFAGVTAVILGYLKLAEIFKIWPYHK